MADLADAFLTLPGGAGTLEEFFEVWTWAQLGLHHKPVGLLDVDGFFQPLMACLDHLVAEAVLDALGELERDPLIGHALRGRLTGLRSYRVGVYRIIHQLRDESTVRVVAIRHRGDAYTSGPR